MFGMIDQNQIREVRLLVKRYDYIKEIGLSIKWINEYG